jgi:hypothetical protein
VTAFGVDRSGAGGGSASSGIGELDVLRLLEGAGAGPDYVQLQAPTLSASWTLTFPADDGTANQFLQTDGSGATVWASAPGSAGGTDVAVADGGTGASTAAGARENLGLDIAAKGDLYVGTAADTVALLSVGTDGFPLVPLSGATAGLAYLAPGIHILNGSLAAAVAASALTISLKTAAGSDPSATDPVFVAFRSATATDGTYSLVKVTAATSVVVSSGSTLGTVSAIPHRLWVVAFNDGGTFRLGVINTQVNSTGSGLFSVADDALGSSTAEGGAGGADSAGVIYTGSAVTAKAMRVVGYVESTQGTAGTWATAPSKIQQWSPGMKLPGDRIQFHRINQTAVVTTSSLIPSDNTIPQISEGSSFLSQAITPTSGVNILRAVLTCTSSVPDAGSTSMVALFQSGTADALAAQESYDGSTTGGIQGHAMEVFFRAGTVSSTTIEARVGNNTPSTSTFGGYAGARRLGATTLGSLSVEEIMA